MPVHFKATYAWKEWRSQKNCCNQLHIHIYYCGIFLLKLFQSHNHAKNVKIQFSQKMKFMGTDRANFPGRELKLHQISCWWQDVRHFLSWDLTSKIYCTQKNLFCNSVLVSMRVDNQLFIYNKIKWNLKGKKLSLIRSDWSDQSSQKEWSVSFYYEKN